METSNDGSGNTSYTYDDNGNLIQMMPPGNTGGQRYRYDQRNLLITNTLYVSGTGWVNQAAYVYDGAGDRVRQVDYTGAQPITTTYANDIVGLTQVLVDYDGTDVVVNLFGLDLILQDDGGQDLVLLADGLGSVRVEMAGDSVETVTTYSPYGKVLEQAGERGTIYGFTGEQLDGATGLLYLRARYYRSYCNTRMLPPVGQPSLSAIAIKIAAMLTGWQTRLRIRASRCGLMIASTLASSGRVSFSSGFIYVGVLIDPGEKATVRIV